MKVPSNRKDRKRLLDVLLHAEKGYKVGLIIRTNGKVEGWLGKDYNDMQKAVGGLIELVYRGENFDVWGNEEGKVLELPINAGIAVLVSETNTNGLTLRTLLDNPIHGDVLLMGFNDEGESTTCPEDVMEMAKDLSLWKPPSMTFVTIDEDGNMEMDKI